MLDMQVASHEKSLRVGCSIMQRNMLENMVSLLNDGKGTIFIQGISKLLD